MWIFIIILYKYVRKIFAKYHRYSIIYISVVDYWRNVMFSINGKLFKALTKAGDFIILGVLMWVFSIPVVTLGASVTAAFYVGLKLVRDEEGYVFKDFWKSFKANFKQGLIIGIIIAALGLFVYEDIRICIYWAEGGNTLANIAMYAFIGIALVLVAVTIYVFPLLAKFDNTVGQTLKNSLVLCMHHFGQTFVMLLSTCVLTFVTIKFFTAAIITVPLAIYINSYILSRVFKLYIKETPEDTEE